ncbi:hypothetical protein RR48_08346 [Papilio machaon]|uniref:Uncharacterized protein n=1 Tax=Papilio machaon TaxID=76193 RepID=A0A194R262_PAPMA|nr:hypothetical protein RR48_08346 [Papilio machaon]
MSKSILSGPAKLSPKDIFISSLDVPTEGLGVYPKLGNTSSLSVYRRQALLTARADARDEDDERPLDVGGPASPPPQPSATQHTNSCTYSTSAMKRVEMYHLKPLSFRSVVQLGRWRGLWRGGSGLRLIVLGRRARLLSPRRPLAALPRAGSPLARAASADPPPDQPTSTTTSTAATPPASDLKSIERMVNGLDVETQD